MAVLHVFLNIINKSKSRIPLDVVVLRLAIDQKLPEVPIILHKFTQFTDILISDWMRTDICETLQYIYVN